MLRVGEWRVDSVTGEIAREGLTARLETRALRLLLCLAEHAGEVVSIDALLDQVWPGVAVSPDSVYQAVASLRRVLGDDPKQPAYIATVPRLGYRMVATVEPWSVAVPDRANLASHSASEPGSAVAGSANPMPVLESATRSPVGREGAVASVSRRRTGLQWVAVAAISLALAAAFLVYGKPAQNPSAAVSAAAPQLLQRPVGSIGSIGSIAVLPFLDLTQGMKEEEFADGMTEELIDKLSKIPGLRVPAPTASFYYKGKQVPVAEIARALGVAYVLDGSVRKSGGRVRIAARLVRAENGYVIWTETYERPFTDLLMIQDDIAGEVTKALRGTIAGGNGAK